MLSRRACFYGLCLVLAGALTHCSDSPDGDGDGDGDGDTDGDTDGDGDMDADGDGDVDADGDGDGDADVDGDGDVDADGDSDGAGDADAEPSSGCGIDNPPGDFSVTLDAAGLTRTLEIHVPSSYDPDVAVPLIIDFDNDIHDPAGPELYAFPQKVEGEVMRYVGWYDEPGPTEDREFVVEVLGYMQSNYCVDAARIFTSGHSNDGTMAIMMACEFPEVRAFASRAGNMVFCGDDFCVAGVTPDYCHGPLDGIILHGTGDEMVNYDPYGICTNAWLGALGGCGTWLGESEVSRPPEDWPSTPIPEIPPCVRRDGCTTEQWWCPHPTEGHGYWERGAEAIMLFFRQL